MFNIHTKFLFFAPNLFKNIQILTLFDFANNTYNFYRHIVYFRILCIDTYKI